MTNLLERVKRFGAIKHDDKGRIILWGITGILTPNFSRVIFQEYLKSIADEKECQKILYMRGKLLSYFTFRMISEKYGYKKKLKDKIKLLRFNLGQSAMVGAGHFDLKRTDFKNNVFICVGNSTLAEEYRKLLGIRPKQVDHFLRGSFAAYVEAVTDKEIFCVEKRCIAKGDKSCEFVARPLSDWKEDDDKDFKKQFSETPDCNALLSELGFKFHRKKD